MISKPKPVPKLGNRDPGSKIVVPLQLYYDGYMTSGLLSTGKSDMGKMTTGIRTYVLDPFSWAQQTLDEIDVATNILFLTPSGSEERKSSCGVTDV